MSWAFSAFSWTKTYLHMHVVCSTICTNIYTLLPEVEREKSKRRDACVQTNERSQSRGETGESEEQRETGEITVAGMHGDMFLGFHCILSFIFHPPPLASTTAARTLIIYIAVYVFLWWLPSMH